MTKQTGVRFEEVVNKQNEEVTMLPLRSTKTSAGYDFYTPYDIEIKPNEKVMFFTDVKAYMPEGAVLFLDVRSSMGIKRDLMLANTIGIIDSDYVDNSSNEGNIGICLRNLKPDMKIEGYTNILNLIKIPKIIDLREENTVKIKAGQRVCQGVFLNYIPAENCNSEDTRQGGIGSTSK